MSDQGALDVIRWLTSHWVQIASGMAIGFLLALLWHGRRGGGAVAVMTVTILGFGMFAQFIANIAGRKDWWEKDVLPAWPNFLPIPNTSAWWALIAGIVLAIGVIALWRLNWIGQVAVGLVALVTAIFIVLPTDSSWRTEIVANWKVFGVVVTLLTLGAAIHPQGRLGRVVAFAMGATAIAIFMVNIGLPLVEKPIERTIAAIDKWTECDADCKAERAAREARRLAEREAEKGHREATRAETVAARPEPKFASAECPGNVQKRTVLGWSEFARGADCDVYIEVAPRPDFERPCATLSALGRVFTHCRGDEIELPRGRSFWAKSQMAMGPSLLPIRLCTVEVVRGVALPGPDWLLEHCQ